jgi:hypothetical protein
LSPAPQGTGNDWKNLPGTAQFLSTQTDTMFAYIYKIVSWGKTWLGGTRNVTRWTSSTILWFFYTTFF